MVDKKHILSEIKRTAEENGGKPLGRNRFQKETGIKLNDWCGVYWTKWGDALIEAGFKPNELQSAYDPDLLLAHMIKLVENLKRFPTGADIRMKLRQDPKFPSHNSFRTLGLKQERVRKVLEYAQAHNVSENRYFYLSRCSRFYSAGHNGQRVCSGFGVRLRLSHEVWKVFQNWKKQLCRETRI